MIKFLLIRFITYIIKVWQKTRRIRYLLNFPQCKFYPSCSDYTIKAFKGHGFLKGSRLSMMRFIKCTPLTAGGIDEVPDKKPWILA